MKELHPIDHIDRKAEQELFSDLVSYQSPARILTICDRGGRGKSSLLERLRYNCQHEFKPPVLCSLIELDKWGERDPSPFGFAVAAVNRFTGRADSAWERFAKFKTLYDARMRKDVSVFDEGASSYRPRDMRVMARAEATTNFGEMNAIGEVNADTVYVQAASPLNFSSEQDQRAKDRCVEAFFDDLRAICANQPMVFLLDAWERCDLSLRGWIFETVLANHLLHPDPNMRPEKLAVVIAGRPHAPRIEAHGLRSSEFRDLFDSEEEYAAGVRSIKSLSDWDNEHIREFMVINGCRKPTSKQVDLIRQLLSTGQTLEKVVSVIDDFFRTSSVG